MKNKKRVCPVNQVDLWTCRMCGKEYVNPLAHLCSFESIGPSAPVLTGEDAINFLNKIKENENKKVPRKDYERAKKAYKNFKIM